MAQRTRRGLGSIRKLPSGRYQLRYTDPNGQRSTAKVTFSTKALAEAELNRIQHSIETGSYWHAQGVEAGDLDPKTVTVEQLATHWRTNRRNAKGQRLAPSTLREYQRLIEHTFGEGIAAKGGRLDTRKVQALSAGMVERAFNEVSNRAPREANAAYKHLATLMKYAVKQRIIQVSPCSVENATAYSAKPPEAPTGEQVQIMLECATPTFQAVLALAAFGGLRKGEILALTREDVEAFGEGEQRDVIVRVVKSVTWVGDKPYRRPEVKEPKTPGSIREVVLPPRAQEFVLAHLRGVPIHPEALLFPRTPGSNELAGEFQLDAEWRKVRKLAGFAGRFHSLRTYAATEYGKTGATAAELMERFGHRDIRTAMRYQRTTGRERDLARLLG